ncbi:hypothetical protein SDJN03_28592, partial [Cucurbita argyrosperma subsp. sororia]
MARLPILIACVATLFLSSFTSSCSSCSSSSLVVSRKLLALEMPDMKVPPVSPGFSLPPPFSFFGPNTPSSSFPNIPSSFPNFPFFFPPTNPSPPPN